MTSAPPLFWTTPGAQPQRYTAPNSAEIPCLDLHRRCSTASPPQDEGRPRSGLPPTTCGRNDPLPNLPIKVAPFPNSISPPGPAAPTNEGRSLSHHSPPNVAHDLNALVTSPEVQELLKKAADRRAASISGTLQESQATKRDRFPNRTRPALCTNGRLRFSPSSPSLRPQRTTEVSDVILPGHCLAPRGRTGSGLPLEVATEPTETPSTSSFLSSSGDSDCRVQTQDANFLSSESTAYTHPDSDSISPPETTGRAMSDSSFVDNTQHEEEPDISDEESEAESAEQDAEPPHEPLSFQIPEDALRKAMLATPNSAESFYSQDLYRGPQGQRLAIHYCHTLEIARRVLPYFLKEEVLGFDIEWKPHANPKSIKENASLIQIASADRVAMFHISLYPGTKPEELLPDGLRAIIESPNIYKVGVAIKGDFTRLAKYLGVKPQGVFELSRLHNLVENYGQDAKLAASRKLCSLATQVKQHLLLPMYKGEVRESDWTTRLQSDQRAYAATDAYASFRLYDALEAKRRALRPIPPRPAVCDYDPAPRPSASRPKSARKEVAAPKKQVQESLETPAEPDEEGESSAYETAAEDLVDSQELEDSLDLALSTLSAEKSPDLDARQVPPSVDEAQVQDLPDLNPQNPHEVRRVGRLRLDASKQLDYPSLPSWNPAETCPEHKDTARTCASRVGRRGADVLEHNDAAVPELNQSSSNSQMGIRSETIDLQTECSSSAIDLTLVREDTPGAASTQYTQGQRLPPSRSNYQQTLSDFSLVPAEIGVDKLPERSYKMTEASTAKARQGRRPQPTDTAPAPPSEHSHAIGPPTEAAKPPPHLAPAPRPTSTTLSSTSYSVPQIATTAIATEVSKAHEVIAAEAWAQAYLLDSIPSATVPPTAAQSRIRATMSHLRAYHLWHYENLEVGAISGLLRQPPLAESTVANYILQAVTLEKLPYRKEDIRTVLAVVPYSLRMSRWSWMVKNVGDVTPI